MSYILDALKKAELSGRELAEMQKKPFESRDDRDHWYDTIPYLMASNAEERRLLAAVTYEGLPAEKKELVDGSWAVAAPSPSQPGSAPSPSRHPSRF